MKVLVALALICAAGGVSIKSVKDEIVKGTSSVAGGAADIASGAASGARTVASGAASGARTVASGAASGARNATLEVTEAGADVIGVKPDDVCYDHLGCFSMSAPWWTVLRPLPAPHTPESINTRFYLYTSAAPSSRFDVIQDGAEFQLAGSGYDGSKTTYFITHGFASDGNSSWLSDMKDAILKRYDGNVFLVDWGKGASLLNYFQVAANTRVVGATLSNLGKYLIKSQGSDASRFHVIGHSLGAQISSYMAKSIPHVAQLTALDPAQPAFEGFSKEVRLDQSDADFIQVLHTSSRPFIPLIGLGMIQAYGHVDFYMNGGWEQPGCILPPKPNITSFLSLANVPVEVISNFISCPHGRSYEFFTASIKTENCLFWGHRASVATKVASAISGGYLSQVITPDSDCDGEKCSPLGFEAINFPARGSFNVPTKHKDPFCISEPDVDSKMRRFRSLLVSKTT